MIDKELNPFHKPHYLIMNLAVGGAWAGEPGYGSFPATFAIDYVRVYQKPSEL
ncbi:glycoside hydrolase family 16 protein [Vibrio astriarenae]|uniref:glycoside hydrolase family 16 protein n=1 Tax=Vibrio astriarenae TaxID=1481923 RepID=UPI003736EEC4